MAEERSYLILATNRGEEIRFQHPLNPNSEIHGHQLGRLAGLQRTGINLIRLPPGKESFLYHSHETEEEWLYVLSGRAIAEIGDREYEVSPGDFMGFPAPSVAHHMRNPFAEECVYLCGGEHRELEVAAYPRLGLRLIRRSESAEVVNLTDLKPVG